MKVSRFAGWVPVPYRGQSRGRRHDPGHRNQGSYSGARRFLECKRTSLPKSPKEVPRTDWYGRNGHIVDTIVCYCHIVHMASKAQKLPKAIKDVPEKEEKTFSFRSPKPDIQGLTPNEMRLAEALSAVISATGVGGKEALRVMRTIGERIEIPEDAEDEAFERVRLRSLGADVELGDAEGGGLSDSEFAARMGVSSRETIRQYRGKGLIFAWPKDMRSYRYPAWQIHRRQLLPGLAEVLAVLREKQLEPFSIIGYFLTPSDDLDDARPLDLLREGKVAEVVADAKRYGDIGS